MTLVPSLLAPVAVNGKHLKPAACLHPLNPLSSAELEAAANLIRDHAQAAFPNAPVWFKNVTLREPPKAELVPWLLASRRGERPSPPSRMASGLISQRTPPKTIFTEYVVDLSAQAVVTAKVVVDTDHAPLDHHEMLAAEKALLNDPGFAKVVQKLALPEGAVILADPWPYGADSGDEMPRLIKFMAYFRLSDDPDSNHYALPLPLIPVLDPDTMKLHSIHYTPIYGGESTTTIEALWAEGKTFPWEKLVASEYKHDLQGLPTRTDLSELQVVQPNGPGFVVDGQQISWQKWQFLVGFNYREGLTIHDVRYDGRDVFHRLSVSDMTVPYGDPRPPFHRKQAFDLGDVGAGICANQLDLGCDCLGAIKYFSADIIDSQGKAQHLKNVICVHEQDDGIGWKHTHYRTGKASVTRSRILIVQMIITVANYEYVFAWKFDQAAGVHLETRATGILSTHAIIPGEVSPYGNIVNPGVLAPNHQHLFSLRIDPAIGALGEGNTVVQEDSVPMPYKRVSPSGPNPYGVGYTVEKTPIEISGFADAAPHKNRVFKIINPHHNNPVSGRSIGYKLVPAASQLMLAHEESIGYARAEFGSHHIWVTQHRDGELFSGGEYTNQSNGGANGILSWVAREDKVADADLVLWHTFGLTHNPRAEDFPVMPCETHMISLKPADFFVANPALDVPASVQQFNKSVLVAEQHAQAAHEKPAGLMCCGK